MFNFLGVPRYAFSGITLGRAAAIQTKSERACRGAARVLVPVFLLLGFRAFGVVSPAHLLLLGFKSEMTCGWVTVGLFPFIAEPVCGWVSVGLFPFITLLRYVCWLFLVIVWVVEWVAS